MRPGRRWSILFLIAGLTACATIPPRFYSDFELARVAERCRVPRGDVAQIGPEVELLYMLTPEPSEAQLDCVEKWANRHGLLLVYVESISQELQPTEP